MSTSGGYRMTRFAAVASLCMLGSPAIAGEAAAASQVGAPRTATAGGSKHMRITRSGTQPSQKGPAEWFIGLVRVDPLFQATDPSRTSAARP